MIKLKDIDSNGNKIINYSRNGISYVTLLKKTSWNLQEKKEYFSCKYQKVFPNSIKPVVYIFEATEKLRLQCAENLP